MDRSGSDDASPGNQARMNTEQKAKEDYIPSQLEGNHSLAYFDNIKTEQQNWNGASFGGSSEAIGNSLLRRNGSLELPTPISAQGIPLELLSSIRGNPYTLSSQLTQLKIMSLLSSGTNRTPFSTFPSTDSVASSLPTAEKALSTTEKFSDHGTEIRSNISKLDILAEVSSQTEKLALVSGVGTSNIPRKTDDLTFASRKSPEIATSSYPFFIPSGTVLKQHNTPHKPEDTTSATIDASSKVSLQLAAATGTVTKSAISPNPKPEVTKVSRARKHIGLHKEKRRPPRKPEPKEENFISDSLRQDDIIGSRGGESNNHPGNIKYWEKILEFRGAYLAIGEKNDKENRDKKDRVAQDILDYFNVEIRGRFLDRKDGRLYELDDKSAKTKIKQAFRDLHIPLSADWYKKAIQADCVKGPDYINSLKRYRLREILINEFGMEKEETNNKSQDGKLIRTPDGKPVRLSDDELRAMVNDKIRQKRVPSN